MYGGVCIWESAREPRALRLSGFEWQFLCICDWMSVYLYHFFLSVGFREMWG